MKKLVILACLVASLGMYSCDKDNGTQTNGQDNTFVEMAAAGNQTEIVLGQLAADSGSDPSIKAFAQMMVTDHTAAQSALAAITSNASGTIDANHLALIAQLDTLKGRAFDSTYIVNQVLDHKKMQILFQNETTGGLNSTIINYAYNYLSTINTHVTNANNIAAQFK